MSISQPAQSSAPIGSDRHSTNHKPRNDGYAPSVSSVFSRITGVPSEYSEWHNFDDIGPSISNAASPLNIVRFPSDNGGNVLNPFVRRDSISLDSGTGNVDISYAEDKFERLRNLYKDRLDLLTSSLQEAISSVPSDAAQSTSETGTNSPVFIPSKIEQAITSAKNKEREDTILRLQEELATKDADFARWHR